MKDTLSTSVGVGKHLKVPQDFGVFNQLADYGALGLAVLGLGFVAWFLFKRNLDEQDRMKRKMEELERQNYTQPVDANRAAAIQEQAVVAKMAPAKKPRAKKQ